MIIPIKFETQKKETDTLDDNPQLMEMRAIN